nr:Chain E, GLN-ALA-SER-GLN-ASP-VAL-LYS-ASN-TRP [unidentified]5IND_F Chain F, GLN-ALA-SER-GLN-ASP-VAL-LYS-ASN-TRP [unidentified]
QASQDVKNW